jgi:hypothetical protein
MNPPSVTRFLPRTPARPGPFVLAAAIAAAALALVGCGPSSSSSSAKTASPTSAAKATASATATSNASGTSGGQVTTSALFPAEVGNTWVYDETVSTLQGTGTNRITAIAPTAGGQRVTMTDSTDFPEAALSKTTTGTLIFHPDGSISVPIPPLGSSSVSVKSGSVTWPSATQLAAGQSRTSPITLTTTAGGKATTTTVLVTVKDGGSASVTVPAGTYQTTIIDETMTEHFEGIALDLEIQNWDADGVGPVKTDVISTAEGHTTTVSTDVMKSFTKG